MHAHSISREPWSQKMHESDISELLRDHRRHLQSVLHAPCNCQGSSIVLEGKGFTGLHPFLTLMISPLAPRALDLTANVVHTSIYGHAACILATKRHVPFIDPDPAEDPSHTIGALLPLFLSFTQQVSL